VRILKIFLMVSILIAQVFSSKVFSQPQENTLSKQAEDYFRHGLAAAKSQKWDMALKYFTQAQEEAPYNPQVLFNLGLAYEKAGFEIFAIAWLHAYLAAAPGAENTAAVEQEIVNLEIASESKAKKLFVAALEIYKALPEEKKKYSYITPSAIFRDQAKSGDIDGAVKTATLFGTIVGELPYTREKAISDYAEQLADEGDLDAARDLLGKNPGVSQDSTMEKIANYYLGVHKNVDEAKKVLAASGYKSDYYCQRLINGFAVSGRYADAIALLEKLSSNDGRFEAWLSISQEQAKAGKIDDARKSLQAAVLLKSTSGGIRTQEKLVDGSIAIGDLAAAMDMINKMEPGSENEKPSKDRVCVSLAMALLKQGKADEAKNWIAKVSDENSKLNYYLEIKDFPHAEAGAIHLNQHPQFMFGQGAIAYARIQALKFKDKTDLTCQDALIGLPKFDVKNDYFFKWLSCFFAREGNMPQAQKILDCITSRDPMYLEMALYEIIGKYLGKGDLKEAGSLLEKYNSSFFPPLYGETWLKMWFSYIDACLAAGKTDQAIMGLRKAKMVVIASGLGDYMDEINKRLSGIKASISGNTIAVELWVGLARDLKRLLSLSDPEQYFIKVKSDQAYLALYTAGIGVDMAAAQRRIKRIEKMLKESS
jgi:tetratricopeptide (TPR) repeat protein